MNKQVEVLVKDIVGRLYPADDWRRNNLHIGPYYDESVVFSTIARLREIGYVVSSYFSFTSHGWYIDVR